MSSPACTWVEFKLSFGKLSPLGRFNNYVTLKLLTYPAPSHHALSRLFTRTLLRYVTISTNTPRPSQQNSKFPIKYNSKFKYKHSNLRLKHYLHYRVRWKGTSKGYKTCYFGLHILYMQCFL